MLRLRRWEAMDTFDDNVPGRRFDNFQFLNFHSVENMAPRLRDTEFARRAFMEIPIQYVAIRRLRLLNRPTSESACAVL